MSVLALVICDNCGDGRAIRQVVVVQPDPDQPSGEWRTKAKVCKRCLGADMEPGWRLEVGDAL